MGFFIIDDSMRNNKIYNGTTYKFGITLKGIDYIVKFPKNNDMSVFCEYICSGFIRAIGVNCHNVYLGIYNNCVVSIIEDFTSNRVELHAFKDTKQSSEDTDLGTKDYTYDDVLYLIDKHLKMDTTQRFEAKKQFWQMFICDAILGNRDRHWGNWGYLRLNNGMYKPAPLFDNGAGLYPGVNSVIQDYINSSTRKKFLYDRVFTFPASLFKVKKSDRSYRSNYYEMFGDLRVNKIFAKEVGKIKLQLSWKKVYIIIRNIVLPLNLPNEYKRFYVEIVTLRFRCIILRDDFNKSFKELEDIL